MEKNQIEFSEATRILYEGEKINGVSLRPESAPIFLTTAFSMGNLNDVQNTYDTKGYTYVRTRNPNRNSLGEAISYLEKGKYTLIFSSGMGAITTTYFSLLKPGDHFIANKNIYGETFDVINLLLKNYGVSIEFVDFTDLDAVKKSLRPNTRMLYTEVASNPTDRLADIEKLAVIAHSAEAMLMVDNTFTTPIAVKPLALGADIVINSLTKFINGHSDALAGSITVNDQELFDKIHQIRMLVGTSGCPFSAWEVYRGIHTIDLRVKKQMKNAHLLAASLERNSSVIKVNHPSLKTNPQYELAMKIFRNEDTMTGMLSFEMPDDREKIDKFMDRLNLAHYAPTLGGIRTTLSHPLHSSHYNVPKEELKEMGISYGLMRVSVGIEDAEDLIADFNQALEVF
ncbi:MAG: aminotransferase class I/II-fold pyridoxal phosphate-dependent enzyme [Clostridium sp.]|jgi:cystathionine gamma-synthase|uniref:trans-sulfuration enzyme family protein n=1 Tax=Clostridium sp. TaxID=1506 RepID=UPI0025C033B0|nr:aminotransferase class I/II-fold pyridoxal phosphate-dependent enzyme [Clostridium sp.]MCH3964883.1 aminotransferase class I/II-fold pyridoxal phosphate-dependent enzyme [Clostridium sp.]MCI1716622.1 aminotransferase class I/II-fold pyridoxal phosphate-dependent enzyme [Clostridium sp.]MCI1800896.1 aminotransferase class I/II-fold pyridoxal phosphate-dependent enzyme [Clostridium sp.]MCI1814799.1 aminotransferase class I/II-fold pyridoxal phosphate-dependent enzyme [Clostridium sp.]MCI18716